MRHFKKNPPVVIEKKKKKGKRIMYRVQFKENGEPTISRKETKMYKSLDPCGKLNTDQETIYQNLKPLTLTSFQLRDNQFPHDDGFKPPTEVEEWNNFRTCARCKTQFEIYNGVYLSDSKCHYHPRRTYLTESNIKIYECCSAPVGSGPCATSNHHVTVQHQKRPLTKTSSRRHIKKELQRAIFALDCEMSFTTDGLEVVRVSVVNLNGIPVYDMHVKPKNTILDYNTMYSGVDKTNLEFVTNTIEDVRAVLNSWISEDTILIGHALNHDLAALGLIHNLVVDTSVLYENRENPMKKISLKTLAAQYLGWSIQDSPLGHDSVDDARASLQLALQMLPKLLPQSSNTELCADLKTPADQDLKTSDSKIQESPGYYIPNSIKYVPSVPLALYTMPRMLPQPSHRPVLMVDESFREEHYRTQSGIMATYRKNKSGSDFLYVPMCYTNCCHM